MASFNKVILMGRLTAAPELKQTQSGTAVTSFSLAVNRRHQAEGQQQADFINCTAWRATAEFISKYFRKGQAILVCGELQTRSWEDQQGNKRYATEVVASEVTFCEAKKDSETNSLPSQQNGSNGQNTVPQGYNPYSAPSFDDVGSDDDLPF